MKLDSKVLTAFIVAFFNYSAFAATQNYQIKLGGNLNNLPKNINVTARVEFMATSKTKTCSTYIKSTFDIYHLSYNPSLYYYKKEQKEFEVKRTGDKFSLNVSVPFTDDCNYRISSIQFWANISYDITSGEEIKPGPEDFGLLIFGSDMWNLSDKVLAKDHQISVSFEQRVYQGLSSGFNTLLTLEENGTTNPPMPPGHVKVFSKECLNSFSLCERTDLNVVVDPIMKLE